MKCIFPVEKVTTKKGIRFHYSHRCGQCLPCRITRRQEWSARLLLESKNWENNTFLTLTIAEDDSKDFPPGMRTKHDEGHQLNKQQLQKFIKRLRKYSGRTFRYFAVGEYGENYDREHYHLALFNYPFWDTEPIIQAWDFGIIQSDPFTKERSNYICGYVTKKLTTIGSVSRGRNPEFAIMSRGTRQNQLGGLGVPYLYKVAHYMQRSGLQLRDTSGLIRINGTLFPLDRYCKLKLAEILGEKEQPEFQKWLKLDMLEDKKRNEPIIEIEAKIASKRKADRIMRRKKGTL
jgi:hypothetical protein